MALHDIVHPKERPRPNAGHKAEGRADAPRLLGLAGRDYDGHERSRHEGGGRKLDGRPRSDYRGTPKLDDDNAYLKRDFCVSELRWAFDAKKHVQPVVRMDDKDNIGAFIKMAPEDLRHIGNIDFVDLNTTNQGYWQVGVDTIIQKAEKAGAFPKPESAAPSKRSSRYLSSRSVVAPAPDKSPAPASAGTSAPTPDASPDPAAGAPAPAAAGQSKDNVLPFDDVTGFTVSS